MLDDAKRCVTCGRPVSEVGPLFVCRVWIAQERGYSERGERCVRCRLQYRRQGTAWAKGGGRYNEQEKESA